MAYRKEQWGVMPSGEAVTLYTLYNDNGVSASFTDLGGTWVTMNVPDRDGKLVDVVLGYDSVEAYLENPPHFGAPIGRNANRIAGAKFTLNGKEYRLAANDGTNNLHSAPDLYHDRLWEAETEEGALGTVISFSLFSPDGDQGYPGDVYGGGRRLHSDRRDRAGGRYAYGLHCHEGDRPRHRRGV